jgi:hypothetical protein
MANCRKDVTIKAGKGVFSVVLRMFASGGTSYWFLLIAPFTSRLGLIKEFLTSI